MSTFDWILEGVKRAVYYLSVGGETATELALRELRALLGEDINERKEHQ